MATGKLGCYAKGQTDRRDRASSRSATVPRLPGEEKDALVENLSAYPPSGSGPQYVVAESLRAKF